MLDGDHDGKVCIYVLRETSKIWYDPLSKELLDIDLTAFPSALCVFRGESVIILCYVNYLLVMSKDSKTLEAMKLQLSKNIPGNDLCEAPDCLGMKISRGEKALWLGQYKYGKALLSDVGCLIADASVVRVSVALN